MPALTPALAHGYVSHKALVSREDFDEMQRSRK